MEKLNFVPHRNGLEVELHRNTEVLPKLKGLRQVKCLKKWSRYLTLMVMFIGIGEGHAQKQVSKQGETYKFNKCDNTHYVVESGYTLNEPVIDNFIVTLTKDSIIFSKAVITATKQTRFKIVKKDEYQQFGLNKMAIIVADEPTRTVITILIEDKYSSPSDMTIVKRISAQFDQ